MRILKHCDGPYKVSVILLDWGVRESFHAIDYLNDQSAERRDYEVIWIELYSNIPDALRAKVASMEAVGKPGIDQWIVVEAAPSIYFHKHFAYNIGIALASGDVCVICDSDVIFPRDFVEKVAKSFDNEKDLVVHVDEVRNYNQRFYPFNYPTTDEVLSDKLTTNWTGTTTTGLVDGADTIHDANYGACMAAMRRDLIAIGGADEHLDYLGYICGPYEMTFRLINYGRHELWLRDLFLVHTWHPGEGGDGNLAGPDDGRGVASHAIEAKNSGRVQPFVTNDAIALLQTRPDITRDEVIKSLEAVNMTAWHEKTSSLRKILRPSLIVENINGNNIIRFDGSYYAFPQSMGAFYAEKALTGEYDSLRHGSDLDALVDVLRSEADNDIRQPAALAPGCGSNHDAPIAPTYMRFLLRCLRLLTSGWRSKSNAPQL